MHRAADPTQAHVLAFSARVAPGSAPRWVDCRPVAGEPRQECFAIVPEQVAAHGGAQLVGWALWEWPHVLIEAEFHAVWQAPGGELLDLTPHFLRVDRVLFVPDPNREYGGVQVDNVRQALVNDGDLTRLIVLHRRRFELLNQGELAHQHGQVALPARVWREIEALEKEMPRLEARLARRYAR